MTIHNLSIVFKSCGGVEETKTPAAENKYRRVKKTHRGTGVEEEIEK